jgi:hypothetical protein
MKVAYALFISLLASWLLSTAASAAAPDFAPQIYADGNAWGTKAVTDLPIPNIHNRQSFDKLFVIRNSNNAATQLPVGEAAPRNRLYNGGRWFTYTVDWTQAGFTAHGGTVPILTSYAEVAYEEAMGHLAVTQGSFPGGPPLYFLCPLLPVKN